MFKIPQPDGVRSAGDVKEIAADVIGELPLPGIEGSRGGRDLPARFTFGTFCDWIRHVLEQELERRWGIEMNGTGVPDAYDSAAG